MDEETGERREVDVASAAELLHDRGQGRSYACRDCRGVTGQRRERLDVQDADDTLAPDERQGQLRADPGCGRDEHRVARDVEHELRGLVLHGPPDNPFTRREPLGDHRVAARPHQPEPPVLEHQHCCEGTVEVVVQRAERFLDRERRLCLSPRRVDRRGAGGLQLLARDSARGHEGV